MKNIKDCQIKGVWYDKNSKVSIPKMKVAIDKNNRAELELMHMSKVEQEKIILGVKAIYGDNFRIETVLGGVRVYAPSNL